MTEMRATCEALADLRAQGFKVAAAAVLAEAAVFERAAEALRRIRENATSWHGDDAAKGRALAVIAGWADEALADLDRLRGQAETDGADARPSGVGGRLQEGLSPIPPSVSACPCDGGEGCVCQ